MNGFIKSARRRVKFGYNIMKWNEYFVSLQTGVFITEEYNVTLPVRKKRISGVIYEVSYTPMSL